MERERFEQELPGAVEKLLPEGIRAEIRISFGLLV